MAKQILVIEEDQPTVQALKTKLTQEGFHVITTGNGEDGLATAIEKKPDLILLDIVMPKMDGITMLKKLREDDWGKEANVILLTNLTSNEKIQEALEQGTYEYLIKADWKIQDIVEKVKETLHE